MTTDTNMATQTGMATETSVVVLVSGSGSNLQALIDHCHLNHDVPVTISAVISNKATAFGLTRAQQAAIPTRVIDHKGFEDRESFDRALRDEIESFQPDLVALAGFMRILTEEFTEFYRGKMLNIHPSLLPKYQGLNTHQRALDAGDSHHGASIHFVTAELDGGPVCLQASVPIEADDTADALAARVLGKEHVIYPLAVTWFAEGRLVMNDHQAVLDGRVLPSNGHQLS